MNGTRDEEDLVQLIRREVWFAVRGIMPSLRFGIVASYNPTGPAVRLTLPAELDDNGEPMLSAWMPMIMPTAGAGAGDIAAPSLGDQMMFLHSSDGSAGGVNTFALGAIRSQKDPVPPVPGSGNTTPAGAPEGERWIVHPSGTGVYLRSDGTVLAGAGSGTFQRLATEDFVLQVFNAHTHKYIPGTGIITDTQMPTQQVPSDSTTDLTAQLKAT